MIYKREYFKSTEHFSCDTTPKRKVEYFEFEIYDNGTGFASIDNILYPHGENMVIFAKPKSERFTIGSYNCRAIHFTCTDDEISSFLYSVPDCVFVGSDTKAALISLFEKTSIENSLNTMSAVFSMLNIINNLSSAAAEIKSIPAKIVQVKEYIDKKYQTEIDLNELQKIADLSINYIRNRFLFYYGLTVQQYIIDLRLSYVKKLLISTDMPLCDIAYESGFNSQSHMNYMFKSRFGISPLRFKTANTKL